MRVLKPITTPMHYFPAGAEISIDDIDGPLTAYDWMNLGHIEAPQKPAKPTKVVANFAPTDPSLTD
jgi:hypothetical protein